MSCKTLKQGKNDRENETVRASSGPESKWNPELI